MRILIIGGTGLISLGIVKHLQSRGADITLFNRGQRSSRPDSAPLTQQVRQLVGDRNEFDVFERRFTAERFDVVIDMIAFTPQQAMSSVRAFRGRCEQFIFCSTVCVYGSKISSHAIIDEQSPREPISDYGRNKKVCEDLLMDADARGDFRTTIIRPSSTYGEGGRLIDNLEFDPVAWDRITKGLPVLCAGDGLGLWNSTHRDDVGKLFAYAALNPVTYGEAYNATTERVFTWRDYYREAAAALGCTAHLVPMPASWIIDHDPARFGLLREITQFHGPYTSAKARHDVPHFSCDIDFRTGAERTLNAIRASNAWRTSDNDPLYQSMIDKALSIGVRPIEA
jgi:nucleoside-diphosphate-sugar epimerase